MASFSRGQLPARHTNVVDENQRPLKTGSPGCGSLRNDGTSSKPYCKGRDVAEDSQGGACVVLSVVVVRDVRHVTIFL